MISLLAAELALSAWGPLAGTEVTDAPAQGAKKMLLIRHAPACGVPRAKASRADQLGYGQISLRLAFRLFVSWSVRILIVGTRGGLLDRNYAICAQEISSGKVKTANQLADKLADVVPTDALFETAFAEARVSKEFLARYYLRALELKRKADPEPEFVPMDDENVINLEHILPENPDNKWSGINSETADAYHRRLGNMVILQAKKNSQIGNGSFNEKRKTLKESAFLLTAEVAKQSSWGIKEITDRQRQLAKLAVETWPLSY